MKHHLNTLFVTTQGSYLAKDGQAVAVRAEHETVLRVPIHHLGGIVCFGRVGCSPPLMHLCAQQSVAISFMTEHGRFLARVVGFTPGNVLLRREQYRRADCSHESGTIARSVILGKIANTRSVLLRAMRDRADADGAESLQPVADRLGQALDAARSSYDLDQLRGIEGDAANDYFGVFGRLLLIDDGFVFNGRSRRPPRDNVNCLLSFLYAMLSHDARSACEAAGLDPQVGFLHRDRPGRPSLGLDLMEELRAYLCDRLALTLINRRQIAASGFTTTDSGDVSMSDATRKTVLAAYQRRKQETVTHPFLGEKTTVGLIIHLQARLLARYLRGELDAYPPFIWK